MTAIEEFFSGSVEDCQRILGESQQYLFIKQYYDTHGRTGEYLIGLLELLASDAEIADELEKYIKLEKSAITTSVEDIDRCFSSDFSKVIFATSVLMLFGINHANAVEIIASCGILAVLVGLFNLIKNHLRNKRQTLLDNILVRLYIPPDEEENNLDFSTFIDAFEQIEKLENVQDFLTIISQYALKE